MKARDILKIDDFNPLDVDITFLKKVSEQIPQEGYIDPAMAEKLATVCLQAADKAADLLAQATLYLSHCDANRRAAKAEAISEALENKVPSTIARDVYASNPTFKVSSDAYNIALGWHTWLETKRDTLVKTHHLCKDLVRKFDGNMNTGSWETHGSSAPKPTKLDEEEDTAPRKSNKSGWTLDNTNR